MSFLEKLPEELYQLLTGKLDYHDAIALRQTSRFFARVIEIPTLSSLRKLLRLCRRLKDPKLLRKARLVWKESLQILVEAEVLECGESTCRYCCRLLDSDFFDDDQTRIRNAESDFEAIANMHCVPCGASNDIYKPGELISCKDGLNHMILEEYPRYYTKSLTLCYSCLRLIIYEGFENEDEDEGGWIGPCQLCTACESCWRLSDAILNSGQVQRNPQPWPCQHRETLGDIPDRARQEWNVTPFSQVFDVLQGSLTLLLDYNSAWALARTCMDFYSAMNHTTVKRYFYKNYSGSIRRRRLHTLRENSVVPRDAQPCDYCKQFCIPTPGRIYYWKPLAYVDSAWYKSSQTKFRWCEGCSCNHGNTNACSYAAGIYTPCPDCLCCENCQELVERTLEDGQPPAGFDQRGCRFCSQAALSNKEAMEELKRNGCELFRRWPSSSPFPPSLLKVSEERKQLNAEKAKNEAVRSGQWPEEPRARSCSHLEVLHLLYGTDYATVGLSGMSWGVVKKQ